MQTDWRERKRGVNTKSTKGIKIISDYHKYYNYWPLHQLHNQQDTPHYGRIECHTTRKRCQFPFQK